MRQNKTVVFLVTFVLIFYGCQCGKKILTQTTPLEMQKAIIEKQIKPNIKSTGRSMASAAALVYITRKDYSNYIPVILNDEKTRIVSYPHPSDIYFRGKLAYPTVLKNGYLLDNRGIGPNVAFLNFTYEAYSKLKNAPDMENLMNNILDKDPLVDMWNCGARDRFKDEISDLNELIEGGFKNCKRLIVEKRVLFK